MAEEDTIQLTSEETNMDLNTIGTKVHTISGKNRGLKKMNAVSDDDDTTRKVSVDIDATTNVEEEKVPVINQEESRQQSQQPQQQSADESVGIDNKINLLTQKAQIYLELIQDDSLVGGDKFDGDVEKIINASDITQPIPLKLYTELKNCLAQLGDLYNMKANVLVGTLREYLLAAQDLIVKLGDDIDYDKEQKKLEDGKCTPGESEEQCKAKMDAAIARINELKGKMLSIIEEKKGAASQYDGRKTQIEDLKGFFTGMNFESDKIDDLITQAEGKKSDLAEGEAEMLVKLIEHLNTLKTKSEEANAQKQQAKKLEDESADLEEQLKEVAAKKVELDTAVMTAEQELNQSEEEGGESQNEQTNVESGDGSEEQSVVNSDEDENDEVADTLQNPVDGTSTETDTSTSLTSGDGSEEQSVVNSDEDENDEVADTLQNPVDGTSTETDTSTSLTSGDTVSTTAQTPPPIIVGQTETTNNAPASQKQDGPPIPTGEGVEIVNQARQDLEKSDEQKNRDEAISKIGEKVQEARDAGTLIGQKKEEEKEDKKKKKKNKKIFPQEVLKGGKRRKQSKKRRRKDKRKTKKRR